MLPRLSPTSRLLKPDVWLNRPILINGMMIAVIHRVILYQRATLLVLFDDSQINCSFAQGQVALSWCSATSDLQEGTPAPGQVLWFRRRCPQVSSWALAPSHRLIMRLNWCFSLIFASFDVLNPIRRAYLIRASCTWHSDPYGCYLAWTPPGLILPRSKHFSLSLIPRGLKYYSRLAGVMPQQSAGMCGHGIAPGHEN